MNAFLPWLAGLALTLVLAAWLTPRRWWRRPNLQALAVVGAGTLAFGTLFGAAFAPSAAAPVAVTSRAPEPAGPTRYLAADVLNLRSAPGVRAPRVAQLAPGTAVDRIGPASGDWWHIRATVDGAPVDGWASSLWLRRVDERSGAARGRRVE